MLDLVEHELAHPQTVLAPLPEARVVFRTHLSLGILDKGSKLVDRLAKRLGGLPKLDFFRLRSLFIARPEMLGRYTETFSDALLYALDLGL